MVDANRLEISTMNNFDFVRPSTVALWTADDGVGADSGPNGYDLSASSFIGHPGRFGGSCFYLPGNMYIDEPYYWANLDLDKMSICFWMASVPGYYEQTVFCHRADRVNGEGYFCGITTSNRLFFESSTGSATYRETGGSIDLLDGDWHWTVITVDLVASASAKINFYIDGKKDYTASAPLVYYSNDSVNRIGGMFNAYTAQNEKFYMGYLDNIHIYNRILSYAEIAHMYAFQMGWI